jgi:HlyD family secretion protein
MTQASDCRWIVVSLTVCLVAVIISGCAKQSTESTVMRRDIVVYLNLEGRAVAPASARADLFAPYQARVARVYATVGQRVGQGDAVVDLAAPQAQSYYDQARAMLLQARKSLAQARVQYEQQVQTARKQLASAYAAQKQAASAGSLQGGAGPGTPVQPRVTVAPDVTTAQQTLMDAKARMAEGLAPYQQALASAQAQFDQAQAGQKAAQVKSPISGTVLTLNVHPGVVADPQAKKPIATIVDLDALQVRAELNEDELGKLKLGDPAVLSFRAVPNEDFRGSLQHIYSGKAGFLQGSNYVAVVAFRNRLGMVKPNMEGSVAIRRAEALDVLTVPADAVYEVDGKHAVKVREGRRWRARTVETGLSDGKYTEIISGLSEGDVVQTSP